MSSYDITLTSDITVRPIQQMGGDHMVTAAARVSTSGEKALAHAMPEFTEERRGLINYLMKHRHGTPFEHSAMTFFVHAPIFVWREWHRHRVGFSYNEESARYKPLDPVFWIPRRDRAMCPVEGWKPGRPKFRTLDDVYTNQAMTIGECEQRANRAYDQMIARKKDAYILSYTAYREDINAGIAMEVARSVLPVGIYSSCWVTCNPRSLMHFLSLRVRDVDAAFPSYPQAEIEEAALACEEILATGWPITYEAFLMNRRVAP